MPGYIPFTDEQKLRAASVDLPTFLSLRGVELERSGQEYRLAADPYITVRGNEWYDHAEQRGGNAVSFVKQFYSLNYPAAMQLLLGGDTGALPEIVTEHRPKVKERKPFALPPRHANMRWTMRYLTMHRHLPSDILAHFIRTGQLYEGAEPSKDGTKVYRNAIFVGADRDGVPRHAYRHGLGTTGKNIKGNIEGSDAAYSFHHIGNSNQLYVFEAPIDMLSFVAMHSDGWQQHSYVALCGMSEHAMLKCLDDHPHLERVFLCLDNDTRGLQGAARLEGFLRTNGHNDFGRMMPEHKDWNDDLKYMLSFLDLPATSQLGCSSASPKKPAIDEMTLTM